MDIRINKNPGIFRVGLLSLIFICCACGLTWAQEINILTTTADLASIAKSIAGDHGKVNSLCSGTEDPHFLQAKPSYIVMARNADLWIRIGMELEIGYEPPILDGSRNSAIRVGTAGHLDASERILRLEVPTTRITRAMGDIHPQGNPHYWLDPLNGRIIAASIADRLKELSPENADDFHRNLKAFEQALDTRMFGKDLVALVGGSRLWALQLKGRLHGYLRDNNLEDKLGGWLGLMKTCIGQKIIVYHRSWIYFTSRFGLKVFAELEPKPGIPPSPSHLARIIETAKARKVKVILLEPFYPRKAADKVASETGAHVVVCANSVGGQPKATDYLALIDLIVNRLGELL